MKKDPGAMKVAMPALAATELRAGDKKSPQEKETKRVG